MKNKRTKFIVYWYHPDREPTIVYSRNQLRNLLFYKNNYMMIKDFYKAVFRRDKQGNISFWNWEEDKYDIK